MNLKASAFPCLKRTVVLAALVFFPVGLAAQAVPAAKGSSDPSPSKWDIFIGYSYLDPYGPQGTITGTSPSEPGHTYGQINWGAIMSINRFFNNHFGIQIEGDSHIQSEDHSGRQ